MRPKKAQDVKLVVSLLGADDSLVNSAIEKLSSRFGQMDFLSETVPFDRTGYYEEEFGGGLKRRLVSFEGLVPQDGLAEIKLFTNGIEDAFLSPGGKRRVNIDPGVVSLERLVLASCKNFTHRIYIGDGVWADLTLIYTAGGFKDLPWTFPDYRADVMKSWLTRIRARYARQTGKGQ